MIHPFARRWNPIPCDPRRNVTERATAVVLAALAARHREGVLIGLSWLTFLIGPGGAV